MSAGHGVVAAAEYQAARLLMGSTGALPRPLGDAIGAGAGSVARWMGARREVVRSQISASFPDRSAAWVAETTAGCYRHFGREATEMARLQGTGAHALLGRMIADEETERRVDLLKAGTGTIVVAGHLGNWEVAGAYLAARGVPISAVVKRQRNAKFDAWIGRSRRHLGIEPIYMEDAMREIPAVLASGRCVGLVADQDARGRGLIVPFLGRPASTFRGPARLAIRTGVPLMFALAVRDGAGYRLTIETVRHQAAPVESADIDASEEHEVTRAWVERLERQVRERPAQYFWFHRRWKSGEARSGTRAGEERYSAGDERNPGENVT